MQLANSICLITGGTSGIGAATSRLLLERGASVIAVGRSNRERELSELAAIASVNRSAFVQGDVATQEGCGAIVDHALERFGQVDALVHCAGGPVPGSVTNVSVEQWMTAFDVHVHAIFHLVRKAMPSVKQRGKGSIVLISSVAGQRGISGAAAYGVVKGALPQFARILARELADDNIRVNCVSPGIIRTPFQDFLTPEQVRNNVENRIPLHREGTPESVAQVIALLLENDYITGQDIVIDGGLSMQVA